MTNKQKIAKIEMLQKDVMLSIQEDLHRCPAINESKILSENPKVITVKFSELGKGNVLSAFYYDSEAQIDFISHLISGKSFDQIIKIFREISDTGRVSSSQMFHPVVRQHLCGIVTSLC